MQMPIQILALAFLIANLESCHAAIVCYKCDSIVLAACATSLESDSLPTEECQTGFSCASSIVDSVTYRGCSSNTPRGPIYYKTCSESLCNKGVYPPGRLKCHQCSGKACIPAPTSKPRPCLNFKEEDSCYTDVIDEIDTFRGCNSDTQRKPNSMAVSCDTNGCNDSPAITTLTCSKCDSVEARGCKIDLFEVNNASCVITNRTTCSDLAFFGHGQPSCFTYINLDRVIRGCTFDSGTLSLDAENFDTCATDLCNKKCLKQKKCIICDSKQNDLCKSDPKALTASTCEGAEASSCNTCELSDGSVQRGCGVPYTTPGSRCTQCQDDGCNNQNFTKCYKCTSEDSPNCGQWINPNIIEVENCETEEADCVMAVFSNGRTMRGCESPRLRCNGTQSRCDACSGNLCNSGVYPNFRLHCNQCDGRMKCNDKPQLLPCTQYDPNDACFEYLSRSGTMVRGCRSQQTLFYECLLAGAGCRLCLESGCNKMPASTPASLRCHNCFRNETACSWQQTNETLKNCEKDVQFLSIESCFIRHFGDGSTSRGCSLDENESNDSDYFLEQTCTDAGCNSKTVIVQQCKQCRGNVTEKNVCLENADTLEAVLCKNGSVHFEERGCYIKVDGEFIERGCASNLTLSELQSCKNSRHCYYCRGMECNTFANLTFVMENNSAQKIFQASSGLLLLIVPVILFFKHLGL